MNTNLKGYSLNKFCKKFIGIGLLKYQIDLFKEFYFNEKNMSQPFAHSRRK